MILIQEITKQKTGFSVYLSNGRVLKVSEATKLEFLLYTGKEVDDETLLALEDYEATAKGYSYILMLVSRASYSSKMVKDKLIKKEYSEEVADRLVKRALDNGILNDEDYAKARFFYLVEKKNVALKVIIRDLKSKGINEFLISDIIYASAIGEKEAITNRLIKLNRKYQKLSGSERKEKIKAKLYSEGFPFTLIKEGLLEAEENGLFRAEDLIVRS